MAVFSLVVAVAIYGSFEEIGFDPAFPRHDNLGDFGSFYEAGRAALRGENPYDIYPLTYFGAAGKAGAAINLNAPFSVVLFEVLPLLDPVSAARVWNMAATVAYVVTVLLLHASYPETRAPWRLVWAFALSSLWGTLALGQIYTFLALLSGVAWVLLQKQRTVIPAILIGALIAIKPNFLVWPVLLLIAGDRRAGLLVLGSAAVFCLIPVVLFGVEIYRQWAETALVVSVNGATTNGSLTGLAARLGIGQMGIVASAVLLLAMAAWAWLRRPPRMQVSGVALVSTLLASPLAWTGYALFTVPVFFARRWSVPLAIAAILLLIPVGSVLLGLSEGSTLSRIVIGSTYTWAFLLIMAAVLPGAQRSRARRSMYYLRPGRSLQDRPEVQHEAREEWGCADVARRDKRLNGLARAIDTHRSTRQINEQASCAPFRINSRRRCCRLDRRSDGERSSTTKSGHSGGNLSRWSAFSASQRSLRTHAASGERRAPFGRMKPTEGSKAIPLPSRCARLAS
jgi:hypothetical protein